MEPNKAHELHEHVEHASHESPIRHRICVLLLALFCCPLVAQTPGLVAHDSRLGFSYHLPPSWTRANAEAATSAEPQNAEPPAGKKGSEQSLACAKTIFSARHGSPASVITVTVLPFSCTGQAMRPKNLSGFATGVSEGLKQYFQISDAVYGSYSLGSHNFWIERAVGVPKGHSEARYTIEIACSILKKGAVCWMTTAASAGGLRDFENGLVTLDGEPATALVPENAFANKPS